MSVRSSHLESVVKQLVPSLPSYATSELNNIRRKLDSEKDFTREQAADEVIAYIEKLDRGIYNSLGNGNPRAFRKMLINKLPR